MAAKRKGSWLIKVPLILVGTLAGLVLLAVVAVQFFLHSTFFPQALEKIAAQYVDGNLSVGAVNLKFVKDFPNAHLTLQDVVLTYPHSRFEEYYSGNENSDEMAGWGPAACDTLEQMDTLAAFHELIVDADYMAFINDRKINVKQLYLDGMRGFVHAYDSTVSNLAIIKLPASKKDTVKSLLPPVKVKELSITDLRAVMTDRWSASSLSARWNALDLEGEYVAGEDSSFVKAALSLDNLDFGELLRTLGASLSDRIGAASTDALLSMEASTEGYLKPNLMKNLPPASVSLRIPEASVSYENYLKNGRLSLAAAAENTSKRKINVDIDTLDVSAPGLVLKAEGGCRDLLGKDPSFTLDACLKAQLQKAVRYLPPSLKGMSASGNVDLDVNGTIKKSQLDIYKCSDAPLKASLEADSIVFRYPRNDIDAYVLRPDIKVNSMASLLDEGSSALALSAVMDSVNFELGEKIFAKGSRLNVLAQHSQATLNDEMKLHPLVGKITADRLSMRGTDSLFVGTVDVASSFSVRREEQNGKAVPRLLVDGDFGRIFFSKAGNRIFAREVGLTAKASQRVAMAPRGFSPADSTRHFMGRDSLRSAVPDSTRRVAMRERMRSKPASPDYLSEKDFKTADIKFSLGEAVNNLLKKWTPTIDFSVGRGGLVLQRLPLRNSVSGLKARYDNDVLTLSGAKLRSGTSDVEASGTISGIRRASLYGNSIDMDMELKSSRINANELLAALKAGKGAAASEDDVDISDEAMESSVAVEDLSDAKVDELDYSLIIVPSNVVANVDVKVDTVNYSEFEITKVHSDVAMKERCLQLKDTRLTTGFGSAILDAFYSTRTKKDITAGVDIAFRDVTANDVIGLVPKVDEVMPMLKSFKGDLNCDIAATTQLDTNMNILMPSLNGMFKIYGSNLIIEDLGNLKKVARLLLFSNKKSGEIDDMSVYGVIADNELEVFPFLLGIDNYTLALTGLQNFSTGFDYHISMVKSPFLLKLGVDIYGPQFKNWKFRLGKPKFWTTTIPLYTEQVDDMQVNLVSSIKNVLSNGVDVAVNASRRSREIMGRRKNDSDISSEMKELSAEEQIEYNEMEVEAEIDEEAAALDQEIDDLIAGLLF